MSASEGFQHLPTEDTASPATRSLHDLGTQRDTAPVPQEGMLELGPRARSLLGDKGVLPAVHVLVSVQHLLPQLLGLDPAGELEVGELLPQQLGFQERLRGDAVAQPQGWERGIPAAAPAPPHRA